MALVAAGVSVGRPGIWLLGCLLGGAYGLPAKAWRWLPLTLLVPAPGPGYQQGVALALFGVLGALVWRG